MRNALLIMVVFLFVSCHSLQVFSFVFTTIVFIFVLTA